MAVDWLKIKTEYINGSISYRKLAEKYNISASALMQRAAKEKWSADKEHQQSKTEAKTKQKTAEKISDNESEVAAIKSRLKLKIYEQLEQRMNADEIDAADFRRLVQSYKDMCDIKDDENANKAEGVTVIIDV